MKEISTLFRVLHPDGREWTRDEIEDYLYDNESFLTDCYDLLVNDVGYLYALDKCGQADMLDPDEFVIEWNKEKLRETL